jgi:hypothetical protein
MTSTSDKIKAAMGSNAEYWKRIESDFQESDLTMCRMCKQGYWNGGKCICGHLQPAFSPVKNVGACFECGEALSAVGHCSCLFEYEDYDD